MRLQNDVHGDLRDAGKRSMFKRIITKLISEFSFMKGNFLLLVISWVIIDFFDEMPSTYFPLYVTALGGSAATVGLIGSITRVSRAIVQFPGGYFADKYGRKFLISIMTFILAFSYLIYALAPNWETLLIGALISGICSIYTPALNAITMDSLPPNSRGLGFSIINMITSVSTTPSPLIAGWLYLKWGLISSMRVEYLFLVVALIVAAVLRLRLKETVEEPERVKLNKLFRAFPSSVKESLYIWRLLPRSAFILLVISVINIFSLALIQPILTLYVINDLHINPVDLSMMLTALSISMIILAVPCGKLIDTAGKKFSLIFSYACTLLAISLIIFGDVIKLYIAMSLVGAVNILFISASRALLTDIVPKAQRGKASGSNDFFLLLASSSGQLLGGLLYDNISHQSPFFLQYPFLISAILITLFFIKEPKKKEE